ncbi:MAG: terminase large subunit, partial [Bacteroidales bacterium]|nr:terminase large subunit [Bacteroidales bacterium]
MMTNEEAKEAKARCLEDIRGYIHSGTYLKGGRSFYETDPRILPYILDCVREDADRSNLYELLGIRKVLRMAATYPFDTSKVRKVLFNYEGKWKKGKHIEGGLLFSGLKGRTHYQLTPLQVWELSIPFGFMKSAEDWRRKVTECVYFIPRKSSKTTLAAYIQLWFFMFEDYNNEGYCVANSQEQSKILFKTAYNLLHQLDPKEKHIRFTETEVNWKVGQSRECKINALTAGGKTKDGLFAGLVCADEYGSASYVKEKCDMANLLNVVEGSMGPRREPMTVITTTAGRVNTGPFQLKLEGIKADLLEELSVPLDCKPHEMGGDWQFSLVCCPDQWEEDEVSLQKPEVWYKVNRHIGVTIQADYYANEWEKMRKNEEKKKEQITKLFNVFQSARVKKWISSDAVARLRGVPKIDNIDPRAGWICFVGMDFSRGDDLCGMSYLCFNTKLRKFYADCDMWITESALRGHPNAILYREWSEKGWLNVSPGDVIKEQLITARIAEVIKHVRIIQFGYDPYDAKVYINYLSAWLRTMGANPEKMVLPVRQTWGNFNAACQIMERLVAMEGITFCDNPIFPWSYGNCVLEEDRMENVKPVKAGENCKIDPVICLLEGLILMEQTGMVM